MSSTQAALAQLNLPLTADPVIRHNPVSDTACPLRASDGKPTFHRTIQPYFGRLIWAVPPVDVAQMCHAKGSDESRQTLASKFPLESAKDRGVDIGG